MLDDIARLSLMADFYNPLLTLRQREVLRLYHEENLTLSEIAEEFGISRQGVHDTLKNAEHALLEYEGKLGLVARMQKTKGLMDEVVLELDEIIGKNKDDRELSRGIESVKTLLAKLDE